MVRSLLRISVMLVLAAGAGYFRARALDLPWRVDVQSYRAQEDRRQWLRANVGVTLDELRDLIEQGAVVIDARPAEAFEEGHLDTGYDPPVINVPSADVDQNIDRLLALKSDGYQFVLYCTSLTCEYAEDLFIALEDYGFHADEMRIYFPGWEGIEKAGLPTATGPDEWTGFDQAPDEPADANAPDAGAADDIEP